MTAHWPVSSVTHAEPTRHMKGSVVTAIHFVAVCHISVFPNNFTNSDILCMCVCVSVYVCVCVCTYTFTNHLYTFVCVYLCVYLHTVNLCVFIPAGLCRIDWARSAWVSSRGKIEAARCGGPGLRRISLPRVCSRPKQEPPSGVSSRWTPVYGEGEDTS